MSPRTYSPNTNTHSLPISMQGHETSGPPSNVMTKVARNSPHVVISPKQVVFSNLNENETGVPSKEEQKKLQVRPTQFSIPLPTRISQDITNGGINMEEFSHAFKPTLMARFGGTAGHGSGFNSLYQQRAARDSAEMNRTQQV